MQENLPKRPWRMSRREASLSLATSAMFAPGTTLAASEDTDVAALPPGFSSGTEQGVHYVRGGHGPAVILIHGFPQDWTEYRAIMPRLAVRFTVIAVDLPGIGRSAPATAGYEAASTAGQIHGMAQGLALERPYIVGHDLGAILTYAYVRRFADSIRGAMILDVPMPGLAGWDEAVADFWHIRFFQAPGQLAEKLLTGRQDILIDSILSIGKFTPAQRAYYGRNYGAPQLHAALEIYRAFPRDAAYNSAQTSQNPVPLTVAVGAKSFFNPLLATFVEGYRARGMTDVASARISDAAHYVLADNPEAVAELIEHHAGK